jgi:hypothetical protein
MMCETLGCAPSELLEKHPNLTHRDKEFLMRYGIKKMEKQMELTAGMFGGKK